MVAMAAAPLDVAESEAIGEVHLYTIPGRFTLRPGLATTAALFETSDAPAARTFTVRSGLPFRGVLNQHGDDETVPVEVTWTISRDRQSRFGGQALPGGVVRLYQTDAAGRPQLIGESTVRHTAPGQDLRVGAGQAFDLTAQRTQTSYLTRREGPRTIATAGYRVTLNNARDSVVTVEVLEERGGEWRVLDSSHPAESLSSTRTRFRVRVPTRGEAILTYQVQVTW